MFQFNTAASLVNTLRRSFHVSSIDFASPLRKKKVVNPLTSKKQYDRKVRRLEREIARLSALKPTLKPILELKLPTNVAKEIEARTRAVDAEQQQAQTLLRYYLKLWSDYQSLEATNELRQIAAMTRSQEKALKLLRDEYPELYQQAVALDQQLIPYTVAGSSIRKETPPNPQYRCPDGKATDTTKLWKL